MAKKRNGSKETNGKPIGEEGVRKEAEDSFEKEVLKNYINEEDLVVDDSVKYDIEDIGDERGGSQVDDNEGEEEDGN